MKCFLVIIGILFGGWTLGAQPSVRFTPTRFDLGQVPERRGIVCREFSVENTGSAPLLLLKTETACSCTKVLYSKKPLLPGQKALLKVSYDPRKQNGAFLKAIKVFVNTTDRPYIITIKGVVVP